MNKTNYFAQNLAFLRESANLKQADLQSILGIKRNTWSNWENEKSEPNIEMLCTIARFFSVDVGKMITENLALDEDFNPKPISTSEPQSQYKSQSCKSCNSKQEIIYLQKQTIFALQGQVEALQIGMNLYKEKNSK